MFQYSSGRRSFTKLSTCCVNIHWRSNQMFTQQPDVDVHAARAERSQRGRASPRAKLENGAPTHHVREQQQACNDLSAMDVHPTRSLQQSKCGTSGTVSERAAMCERCRRNRVAADWESPITAIVTGDSGDAAVEDEEADEAVAWPVSVVLVVGVAPAEARLATSPFSPP